MENLTSKQEDDLLEEGQEEYYNFKMPMFYPCPKHSEAEQGEHMTAEECSK